MSKISWPNAALRCPTKRSGCDASRSVQYTLAGSSVDRAGWATSGTWTRSSSPSRDSGAISGVPSIKMVTSSISSSSRVATVGGYTLFPQAVEGPGAYAWAVGHRQAEQLQGCAPSGHAVRRPSHGPIREQPCRSLPPAHTATRATNAPVQISRAGTTILVRAWTRPQPLPRWPSPGMNAGAIIDQGAPRKRRFLAVQN